MRALLFASLLLVGCVSARERLLVANAIVANDPTQPSDVRAVAGQNAAGLAADLYGEASPPAEVLAAIQGGVIGRQQAAIAALESRLRAAVAPVTTEAP